LQVLAGLVKVFKQQNQFSGVHICLLEQVHHFAVIQLLLQQLPGSIHIESFQFLGVDICGFVTPGVEDFPGFFNSAETHQVTDLQVNCLLSE